MIPQMRYRILTTRTFNKNTRQFLTKTEIVVMITNSYAANGRHGVVHHMPEFKPSLDSLLNERIILHHQISLPKSNIPDVTFQDVVEASGLSDKAATLLSGDAGVVVRTSIDIVNSLPFGSGNGGEQFIFFNGQRFENPEAFFYAFKLWQKNGKVFFENLPESGQWEHLLFSEFRPCHIGSLQDLGL